MHNLSLDIWDKVLDDYGPMVSTIFTFCRCIMMSFDWVKYNCALILMSRRYNLIWSHNLFWDLEKHAYYTQMTKYLERSSHLKIIFGAVKSLRSNRPKGTISSSFYPYWISDHFSIRIPRVKLVNLLAYIEWYHNFYALMEQGGSNDIMDDTMVYQHYSINHLALVLVILKMM